MSKRKVKANLDKQLKVYSAAAAGVLALAPSAEAAIHYSGTQNIPVSNSASYDIDFDGNGPQFRIGYHTYSLAYYIGIEELTASAEHVKGTSVTGIDYYHYDALRLPGNYQIGPTLANAPRATWATETIADTLNGTYDGSTDSMGNFNNFTGYIGVRFNTECGLAYGWIQYSGATVYGEGWDIEGTIIDWAYEDSCQPIAAGQISASIPTLNEWGMIVFTLLAGGLAAMKLRRLRKED